MKPMTEDTPDSMTTDITKNTGENIAEDTGEDIPTITLASVLKLSGFADTGGGAKMLIQNGDVMVNGEVETRRKRKLVEGDTINVRGEEFVLELDDPELDDPELDDPELDGSEIDDPQEDDL